VRHAVRQCAAVRAAVCSSAACAVGRSSVRQGGSVQQCGSAATCAAARQCAVVCAAMCGTAQNNVCLFVFDDYIICVQYVQLKIS
jgi:hypothetical protein